MTTITVGWDDAINGMARQRITELTGLNKNNKLHNITNKNKTINELFNIRVRARVRVRVRVRVRARVGVSLRVRVRVRVRD